MYDEYSSRTSRSACIAVQLALHCRSCAASPHPICHFFLSWPVPCNALSHLFHLQMAVGFGPTFSIGIRDDNQQNVVLVAKKVPTAYQAEVADEFSSEDLASYKHELQKTADGLRRSCAMPYDFAGMLYELYRIVPNRAYTGVVYELEINHVQ